MNHLGYANIPIIPSSSGTIDLSNYDVTVDDITSTGVITGSVSVSGAPQFVDGLVEAGHTKTGDMSDLGIVGKYNNNGNLSGFVRDYTDSKFKVFDKTLVQTDLDNDEITNIDSNLGDFKCNNIEAVLVDGRDVSIDGTNLDNHIADATIHFSEATIDHTNIINKGVNTHAQIDSHISDDTKHRIIDDVSAPSTTALWSSNKINTELSTKEDSISQNSAFNKNFGVNSTDIPEIASSLAINMNVSTDASGKLITTAGGSGESNTASNLGTGQGVFKQKTGVDLEFKSITATSNKISLANNVDDIGIDIVPANINHSAINDDEPTKHRVIDDVSAPSTTTLWSSNKINTELTGKSDTGHTHTLSNITDVPVTNPVATKQHGNLPGEVTLNGGVIGALKVLETNGTNQIIGVTKFTGFNKNFGTTAGTVLEGSHDGGASNTHAQIDTHISDDTKHRVIDDVSAPSTTTLWSSNKINTELTGKSDTGHTHTASEVTDFNTAADARISAQKGNANGLATLDGTGKVPSSQLALSNVVYVGTWNANTNTPTIVSSTGTQGNYYVVSVAGTTNIDGIADWQVGDWIIFNGSVWEKSDNTDQVTSVAGKQGAVALDAADITTGTFANARISQSNITQHEGAITHQNLSGAGTNTHAQIDTHISDDTKHRVIDDGGSGVTDLWSANKINTELSNKEDSFLKNTAFNKNYGVNSTDIPEIAATLGNTQIVETNASGKLITVAKNDSYNKNKTEIFSNTTGLARQDAIFHAQGTVPKTTMIVDKSYGLIEKPLFSGDSPRLTFRYDTGVTTETIDFNIRSLDGTLISSTSIALLANQSSKFAIDVPLTNVRLVKDTYYIFEFVATVITTTIKIEPKFGAGGLLYNEYGLSTVPRIELDVLEERIENTDAVFDIYGLNATHIGAANLTGQSVYGNNVTVNDNLKILTNTGKFSIDLKAPDSMTSTQSYILPGLDGSAGSVISTDGAGVLTFADAIARAEGLKNSSTTVSTIASVAPTVGDVLIATSDSLATWQDLYAPPVVGSDVQYLDADGQTSTTALIVNKHFGLIHRNTTDSVEAQNFTFRYNTGTSSESVDFVVRKMDGSVLSTTTVALLANQTNTFVIKRALTTKFKVPLNTILIYSFVATTITDSISLANFVTANADPYGEDDAYPQQPVRLEVYGRVQKKGGLGTIEINNLSAGQLGADGITGDSIYSNRIDTKDLRVLAPNGFNYTKFSCPFTLTENISYNLPTTIPTSGNEALLCDNTGTMFFSPVLGANSAPDVQGVYLQAAQTTSSISNIDLPSMTLTTNFAGGGTKNYFISFTAQCYGDQNNVDGGYTINVDGVVNAEYEQSRVKANGDFQTVTITYFAPNLATGKIIKIQYRYIGGGASFSSSNNSLSIMGF